MQLLNVFYLVAKCWQPLREVIIVDNTGISQYRYIQLIGTIVHFMFS